MVFDHDSNIIICDFYCDSVCFSGINNIEDIGNIIGVPCPR